MSISMTYMGMETVMGDRGDDNVQRDDIISDHYLSVVSFSGYTCYLPHSPPASHIPFHNNDVNICVVMSCCGQCVFGTTTQGQEADVPPGKRTQTTHNDAGNNQSDERKRPPLSNAKPPKKESQCGNNSSPYSKIKEKQCIEERLQRRLSQSSPPIALSEPPNPTQMWAQFGESRNCAENWRC